MTQSNLIFTSWLDVVAENDSLKKYDGVTKETLNALTLPGTNGLELIKKSRGIVVLSRASGRRGFISPMHHMDRFWDNAVPATINESSLLETSEETVPKIKFLATLKDEDSVFNEMDSTTPKIKTKICNSIILPPWLAK
eukprot:6539848-Ditylum_brightwellii.AAC.1